MATAYMVNFVQRSRPGRHPGDAMMWIVVMVLLLAATGGSVWYCHFATYHLAAVEQGKLYRDGVRSMRQFSVALRQVRPRTVVRLVDAGEQAQDIFKAEARELQWRGIALVSIPVKLGGWPTTEDVRKFLEVAGDPQRQPVLVHCAQGVRRTGMMVAVYQESLLGYSRDQAKERLLGFGHSQRTTGDISRFIDIYDPSDRRVLETLPQSKE